MGGSRTAIVVPGHGELDEGTHRITERCRVLVAHAEQLAARVDPVVVVFSGWSSTGGLSEAEQMREAWEPPGVELVVEPTARSTAENASRTLPLLLERGVDTAHVVCAPLHALRTRFFFGRLYRSAGVRAHTSVAPVRPSLHALAWELAAVTVAPAQLRRARSELARRAP